MKGPKLLKHRAHVRFVQIAAFAVLCFEQDSMGASSGVSGFSTGIFSAPPGLERVWNVLEPMVQEARDTGQTELEVRYLLRVPHTRWSMWPFRANGTACDQ